MSAPEQLVEAARAAWENAYAPYSGFRVGAALRAEDGRVYAGANVENSSFGLTRCGEQSAVQAMVSAGARSFQEIVVYTDASPPASPCGACRQVLAEFAPHARVHMVNDRGEASSMTVGELLPGAFLLNG